MNKKQIIKLLYDRLYYMYCDNCRFNSEISEEEAIKKYKYYPCEDCHRKNNGWGISKAVCDGLAGMIITHAHWIDGYDDNGIQIDYDCSNCNQANDIKTNYCPNCGALMDERR